MTKAVRMMEENERLVDAIIYVLDARAYKACFNPSFDKISSKPRLYILNKIDTIDESSASAILNKLKAEGKTVVASNSVSGKFAGKVKEGLTRLLSPKIEKYKAKGITKTVRAMVIGVPNSGKSTLINSLCKGARADAQNRPGVTRGKQWIKLTGNIELLDTPGTLWPAFEDQELALHLAFIGCINDNILDTEELACCLIDRFKEIEGFDFEGLLGASKDDASYDILSAYGRKRGFLLRGGEGDTERASKALLDAFRKQRLGKIALER